MTKADQFEFDSIRFTAAGPAAVARGLIGYVSCRLNGGLKLDGLMLRRTADGRPAISFPCRKDGTGRRHFYLSPLDDTTRQAVEQQIFAALGIREDAL